MKEYILDENDNDVINDNSNQTIQQKGKKKNINYFKLIIIFTSLDVLCSLLVIIFIILSKQPWYSFVLLYC